MNFEDFVVDLFESRPYVLESMYGKMTYRQRRIVDEIVARHELSEEEFEELIDDPRYYEGGES